MKIILKIRRADRNVSNTMYENENFRDIGNGSMAKELSGLFFESLTGGVAATLLEAAPHVKFATGYGAAELAGEAVAKVANMVLDMYAARQRYLSDCKKEHARLRNVSGDVILESGAIDNYIKTKEMFTRLRNTNFEDGAPAAQFVDDVMPALEDVMSFLDEEQLEFQRRISR